MFPLQLYLWKPGNSDQEEQKKQLKNCLEHLKGAEANLTLRLQNEQVPSISRGAAGGGGGLKSAECSALLYCIEFARVC